MKKGGDLHLHLFSLNKKQYETFCFEMYSENKILIFYSQKKNRYCSFILTIYLISLTIILIYHFPPS